MQAVIPPLDYHGSGRSQKEEPMRLQANLSWSYRSHEIVLSTGSCEATPNISRIASGVNKF